MNQKYSYEKICELSNEQIVEYKRLLKNFESVNGTDTANVTAKDKGKALENLAKYLLEISGGIFDVFENLRTTTNELDQFCRLKPAGKYLLANQIIDSRFSKIIGECKNYATTVNVTYTGKFCSLLLSNQVRIGILFSYKGVTGHDWTESCGLIRKFYLHKENEAERFCIIDFNIEDFRSIIRGENLLQIIENRINALQLDTGYDRFLVKHDLEMNVASLNW